MLPLRDPCLASCQLHDAAMQEILMSTLSSLGNGDLERWNRWPAATWLVVGERVSRFRFFWSLKPCLLSCLWSVGNVLKCETLALLIIYSHFPKSVCTVIQLNSRYECLLLKPDYDAISIWEISYPTTIDGRGEFFQEVSFLYYKRMTKRRPESWAALEQDTLFLLKRISYLKRRETSFSL